MDSTKSEADLIYDVSRNLLGGYERLHREVEEGIIPASSEKVILKFLQDLDLSNISKHRQYFYLERLRLIAKTMKDNFLSPSGEDIKNTLYRLKNTTTRRQNTFSNRSIEDVYMAMKRFYGWYENGKYLPVANVLKREKNISQQKKPEDIVTQSEIMAMLSACLNPRDKALLSVLYDSGCRIGEILTLRVKDIEFDGFGMRLTVNGKTGVRKVRAVGDSEPHMREYLRSYQRTNPDDYAFIQLEGKNFGSPMKYTQVHTMMRKVMKRAKIQKRIHPHLFRHTRATLLARDMKEAPLQANMGWIQGSRMAKIYVHLDDDDVDRAVLKVYGIEKTVDKERNVTYTPKVCPRCKESNSNIAEYCSKCGLPLDPKVLNDFSEKRDNVVTAMEKTKLIDSGILGSLSESAKNEVLLLYLRKIIEEKGENGLKEIAKNLNL